MPIIVNCQYCNKSFEQRKRYSPSHPDQKYCSAKCYGDHRKKKAGQGKITRSCLNCKKKVIRWPSQLGKKVFCSKSCANQYNNLNPPIHQPPIEKYCLSCNQPFFVYPHRQHSARFCSKECYYIYKGNDKNFRDKALSIFGHKCVICKFDIVVSVHHIVPRRNGGKNNIENLIVLCPNHHAMADRNLISKEELISLNQLVTSQEPDRQHQ